VFVNPLPRAGHWKRYLVPSTASSALFGTDLMDYWFPVSQGGDIAFLYGVVKIILESGWQDRDSSSNTPKAWPNSKPRRKALIGPSRKTSRPAAQQHAGIRRVDPRRQHSRPGLEHGHHPARLRWQCRLDDHSTWGLLEGVTSARRPMRTHGRSAVIPACKVALRWARTRPPFPRRGAGRSMRRTPANCRANMASRSQPRRHHRAGNGRSGGRRRAPTCFTAWRNFLRTLPEPDHVARAMGNVPLPRSRQDIILTDQMFLEAKEEVILLPAKTRYEQDDGGTEAITERRIVFSPEIPRQVAKRKPSGKSCANSRRQPTRTAPNSRCETGSAMREEIARIVPFYDGFQHLNKTGDAFQYGGPHLCADWKFPTPDAKPTSAPCRCRTSIARRIL